MESEELDKQLFHVMKEIFQMLASIQALLTRIATALDAIAAAGTTPPGGLSPADTTTVVTALQTLATKAESLVTPPAPAATVK